MFVDLGAERLTLYGQIADPGRRLGALAVRGWIRLLVFRSASRRWFPGAERLDSLPGVAAAQFGVGGDGQAPGGNGGMIPVLPVGHGLGEGPFSPLVMVAQGAVAGGQGFVLPGAVVVAGLAGRIGLGVGAERAKGGVKGAEPGQPQLFPGMAGCPGGLRRVGVADQPQPPVGHGPDVGLVGRAEDREGFVPGGPLVRCFRAGLGTERSSGWP